MNEFSNISLEKLRIRKQYAQKKEIDHELDNLVLNIKKNGIHSPLLGIKNDDENYDVIDGQRRLNALDLLNQKYPDKGWI